MKDVRNIVILVLIVLIALAVIFNHNLIDELRTAGQKQELLEADLDTLRISVNNKTGEIEYSKKAYIADNKLLNEHLKEKNKELYNLKNRNKANTGAITGSTIVIDTTIINTIVSDTGKRVATLKNEFINAEITSYPTSTNLKIKDIPNEQSLVFKEDGTIMIVNSNKYVKTTSVYGFKIATPKAKSKNWKFVAGVILGGFVTYKLIN